ncbi:hypothetical protein [Galbibacter sp.]|uniref:hypothetical protein n=1 Tax=Galbibacter sp. TaxID=2918471 RepID=UPI003A93B5DC
MKFIKKAFSLLEEFEKKIDSVFPEDNGDYDEHERADSIEVLKAEFQKFQRLSHQNINYSLLSGEYINSDDFQEFLNFLKPKYSELLSYFVFNGELQNMAYQIVECLDKTIDYYFVFITDIKNKYSLNQNDYFFSINSILSSVYRNEKLSEDSLKYFRYFHVNILTARCDHLFSHDDSFLVQLYNIESALSDIKISGLSALSEVILAKCGFLKSKWFLRKQEEAPDESTFIVDGIEHQIENVKNQASFEEWIKYSKEHYQLEINWVSKIKNDYRKFHNKDLSDLTFTQIHRMIKYHKDESKNYLELKKISNFLKEILILEKKKKDCSYFNEFAFSVMSNYALNNSFSLFVEKNKDINNLKSEYAKIKSETNSYLNNFFIEFKFLDSIIQILNDKLEEEDNDDFLKENEEYIKTELKGIFNKYEFNHKWSINHHNYIFQLPFEECKLSLEDNKLDYIFIASSFVLPPSNKKIEKQFNLIKSKFNNLLFHIESVKVLKTDTDKIKNLNNEISDHKAIIQRRETQSIEILGIFTALIAFVFGSISTFQFLESAKEVLMFNVALALSLISFVCVLIIFIRGKDTLINNWKWLAGLFVLFILFWGTLIYFDINPEKEGKIEQDVINIRDLDSLINIRLNNKTNKFSPINQKDTTGHNESFSLSGESNKNIEVMNTSLKKK